MITKKIKTSRKSGSQTNQKNDIETAPSITQQSKIPVLYVQPSIGRSGGPNRHFIHFTIKNVSKDIAALDIRWEIRGFAYEWRSADTNLLELDPLKEKEVVYPISNEPTFLKEIPELNVFTEYSDIHGTIFFSRRELQQAIVPSGAFYV